MARLLCLALVLAACADGAGDDDPVPPEERALSGTVSGLVGSLTLVDFGVPIAELSANGPFTVARRFPVGTPYAVAVKVEPTGYGCVVENGYGTFGADDVIDLRVVCTPDPHTIGGEVTGLIGELTLLDNDGDPLVITEDGAFAFAEPVGFTSDYRVTIGAQPKGQVCEVLAGEGTVGDEDVDSVAVLCRTWDVVIAELHARPMTGVRGDANGDGVRDSGDDEFVEILSREDVAVPIGGWVIATGAASQTTQFVFPAGTMLPPRARAVVFGGPTPTGSFGAAQVFVTSGLSLTDTPATFLVLLEAEHGGLRLDEVGYGADTFDDGASIVLAGDGSYVSHTTVSGSAGILFSPGVASDAAIPKVNPVVGLPLGGATSVSVLTEVRLQFNMFMDLGSLAGIKLYASPCDALANEVVGLTTGFSGIDASLAIVVPPALAFGTPHCLVVPIAVLSAAGVPLAAEVTRAFTTRAAASAPATTVVISEIGGCRFSAAGSAGPGVCAGAVANDEYVELHNPTDADVDVSGWFVQRRTASGTASCYVTLPAAQIIPAHGYYLIGGFAYDPTRYPGAPAPNASVATSAASTVTGQDESLVLIASTGTCTGQTAVVDSVTYSDAVIGDASAALRLPKLGQDIAPGTAIERKACFDSTGNADPTTGMLGGHAALGNRERIGASNADWVARATPTPQSLASGTETGTCP